MGKTTSKVEIEGNFLKLVKNIHKRPTIHISHNGEKLDAFSLGLRTRQRYSLSQLLFNRELDILASQLGRKGAKRHVV